MKSAPFNPEWLAKRLASLIPANASLCVALSGGVDSVVLLTALRKSARLRAIHVHHGLHANADRWSTHCSALAKNLGVPLTTLRVKVPREKGASIEAAARDARYNALASALEPGEVLLTAHHEDDQLETVLLQLMRGAGIAGLAAMPEVAPFARGLIVRPLLTRSRAELEEWARAHGLTWVDDDSNANEQFDRNYLRRQVLPLIRSRWPGAGRAVSRSARHAAEAKGLLDALARADVDRASVGAALSAQRLRALPPDRRRNAVRFWIGSAGHPVPDSTRLEEITGALLDARHDANPFVEWSGVRLQRHAGVLSLQRAGSRRSDTRAPATRPRPTTSSDAGARTGSARRRQAAAADADGATARALSAASPPDVGTLWNWRASARITLVVPKGELSLQPDAHGPIDLTALPEELTIRLRRGGERLKPTRNGGSKTLKSLLQASRIPLSDRANLPLIFSGGTLVAVGDKWIDASVRATDDTPERARLRWKPQ